MQTPNERLSHPELEYWAREFRRLRIRESLSLPFETFMELSVPTRHAVRHCMHSCLRDWRENPRWAVLSSTDLVLGWASDDPAAELTGGEPVVPRWRPN